MNGFASRGATSRRASAVTLLLLLGGAALRFWVSRYGHNYDLESYRIVAEIAERGGNVYAETDRYNYGPVWFYVLGLLERVSDLFGNEERAFRIGLISLLTAVDLGIWAILRRRFGLVAAFLFFLSPISIVITGYHNQFDNLAILLALAAMLVYATAAVPGLLLLALSLTVKHVLLVFPLWLAIKERGLDRKALALVLPLAVFVLSFVPFLPEGRAGIVENVVRYESFDNAPFWHTVLPGILRSLVPPFALFGAAFLVLGFVWRRRDHVEAVLLYLLTAVVFAPAIANQYLALAVPAAAAFSNAAFLAFQALGLWLLSVHPDGLHHAWLLARAPRRLVFEEVGYRVYDPLVAVLSIGLAIVLVPPLRRLPHRAWAWAAAEARAQRRMMRGDDA